MSYEFITIENRKGTALITFRRPECFNAMNRQMKHEIIRAIRQANKDGDVRSLVLTGEGKAFSSGQDLNDRTVSAEHGPVDLGVTLETEWNPLVQAISKSEKIIIAAVNGVCAGAGLSVVLSADLLVSAPKIKYVSGFAQIGLAPDAGSSFIMGRALGRYRALEFFLMGKPLFAEELQTAGLINQIAENPLEEALNLAEKINNLAPLSVKMIKKNLDYALNHGKNDTITRETYVQRFLGDSQDYAEGVKAFLGKRSPQFEGK